ncbi:unnamed protein product [Coccothraustes coccothraustes]
MQALRHTEDPNLELSEAKRLSRAAYSRSCALEISATGTMLSAQRSRFFASASRRTRPLMRRENRDAKSSANGKGTVWAKFSVLAQFLLVRKSGKASAKMQALRHTEDANLELSGAKRHSRAA